MAAVMVSPRLAQGQDFASVTVTGNGTGRTEAEVASLIERAQIAECLGFALSFAVPEKKTKTTYRIGPLRPGQLRAVNKEVTESAGDVTLTFFLTLAMCVDDLKQFQAGTHSADTAASSCPVSTRALSIKDLDSKQIRYTRAGRGAIPGLTATCTGTSAGSRCSCEVTVGTCAAYSGGVSCWASRRGARRPNR